MVKLQMSLGVTGWGIYWSIIEMLYCEGGKIMLSECERIAFELRTECEKVSSVINGFSLFEKDEKFFWSNSVVRRLNIRNKKSETARESAEKRWNNTDAMRTHTKGNAIKAKQSKANTEEEEEERDTAREEILVEKNPDPPQIEIPKNKKSINGSHVLPAAPDLTPQWTDFVVPITREKSVIVSYSTNGNHNCRELCMWWGTQEFQLCLSQCGIVGSNENYLAFVLSEFAMMITTDEDCHRKKFPFRLKTFLSSRSATLLKTFNQKQNTLVKFNEDLEKISGIPPDTKQSFREYYTRIQPAGNYYFEQRNNFVVADELKNWSSSQFKKQSNGSGEHQSISTPAHRRNSKTAGAYQLLDIIKAKHTAANS
jgi:hypothetical protein